MRSVTYKDHRSNTYHHQPASRELSDIKRIVDVALSTNLALSFQNIKPHKTQIYMNNDILFLYGNIVFLAQITSKKITKTPC